MIRKKGTSLMCPRVSFGGGYNREQFEVLDATGHKTGIIKSRAAVHRDGDWHRSTLIWVVNPDQEVLLQKRSAHKDSYPSMWDLSGGHVVAGETSRSAAADELREEIGLAINPTDLEFLETQRRSARPAPGFVNNSFYDYYLLRTTKSLQDFTPQPEEVAELRFFSPAELRSLITRHPEAVVFGFDELEHFLALIVTRP